MSISERKARCRASATAEATPPPSCRGPVVDRAVVDGPRGVDRTVTGVGLVTYPSEVWAVEYTTVEGKRRVSLFRTKEDAVVFASAAPTADPYILWSRADFRAV